MRHHKLILSILFSGFLFFSFSCKKDNGTPNMEQYVTFDKQSIKLNQGQKVTINASFGENVTPKRSYTWTSMDPAIADVVGGENFSGVITGKSPGNTEIRIATPDGEIFAICKVTVTDLKGDGITKILAIGNSFSEDALEFYLYNIAKASGEPVVIGNLYIGGASLEMHGQNAQNNTAAYDFRKIDVEGKKTNKEKTSIATALAAEDWDYISFQQVSNNSGQFPTFQTTLPQLYNYIKGKATNKDVKYVLHQTWAYAQNSTHDGFANYGNDQMTMYGAIVNAYKQAKVLIGADLLVPVGTAIQNGRTSLIEDNFTRDGYHLDENVGRYTAALTWFESIFQKSAVGNLYKPNGVSDYYARIAQNAAHFAVQKPNEVTEMLEYQGVGNLRGPVFIGFGMSNPINEWNGFMGDNAGVGVTINNLKEKSGRATGITIAITERFNGKNGSGENNVTIPNWTIPNGVSSGSYYGNSKGEWNGVLIKQSTLKLTNLNPDKKYDFCFFGVRCCVGDNRETSYTVKGANEKTALLNTSGNKSKSACVEGVQPNKAGELTIEVTEGPNNNNGSGFYYISAIKITPSN
ncbi:MAG: DUF4886 domain-containing protein [Ginsengibacter sp.]